jgi:hypothetical protein
MHSTIDPSNAGAEQKRAAAATIPFTSTLCGESRKELSTANLDANQIALPQFDLDRSRTARLPHPLSIRHA